MRYQISGKHIDIGEALQTHVKAELGEVVEKYAQRPTECTVVFSKVAHEIFCETTIHLSTGLTAQAQAAALDLPHEQSEQREKHENDDRGDDHLLRGREFQSEQALQGLPHLRPRPRVAEAPPEVEHLGYSITLSLSGNMVNAWLITPAKTSPFNRILTMSPAGFAG